MATTFVGQSKHDSAKHDGSKQSEQNRNRSDQKGKSGGGRQNIVTYNLRVAFRYFTTLLQEGFLSAVFAAPIWLACYLTGVHQVTITTDFQTLWVVSLAIFLLNSLMFRKGGGG